MTEAKTVEVTVWVLIDQDGNAVSDCLPEHLKDEYEADIGDYDETQAHRIVKLKIKVPLPKVIELAGEVPEEVTAGGELKVVG